MKLDRDVDSGTPLLNITSRSSSRLGVLRPGGLRSLSKLGSSTSFKAKRRRWGVNNGFKAPLDTDEEWNYTAQDCTH